MAHDPPRWFPGPDHQAAPQPPSQFQSRPRAPPESRPEPQPRPIFHSRLLSPTAINAYLDCPRKFYLRYIKKLKSRPSIHLVRGAIVHRVIERFHRENRGKSGSLTSQEIVLGLLRFFEAEWAKAGPTLNGLGLGDSQLQDYRDESQIMVINFGWWLQKGIIPPPARTEARLVSKRLGLMGVVDAVHRTGQGVVLVDYKTSLRPEITSEMERQAALYGLLYQEVHGQPPEALWVHFLGLEEDPQVIPLDDELLTYGRLTLESVQEKTGTQDEADYPCTCGGRCQRDFVD